jgi:pyruvate kinase
MVARGDLGVEMPLEQVPLIQKRIINEARRAGKPVITATQMLRSMVSNPRPTRAEAADVANAVLDGTDALMLSEESAMGDYPVESVETLHRIAKNTEKGMEQTSWLRDKTPDALPATAAAISRAAGWVAVDLEAAAIVAATGSGSTARLIARFRPAATIVGLTDCEDTLRQMNLFWGVVPVLVERFSDADELFDMAQRYVLDKGIARSGQRIVVTAGIPLGIPGTTNLVKVIELPA